MVAAPADRQRGTKLRLARKVTMSSAEIARQQDEDIKLDKAVGAELMKIERDTGFSLRQRRDPPPVPATTLLKAQSDTTSDAAHAAAVAPRKHHRAR
jgi:hypothetical protein